MEKAIKVLVADDELPARKKMIKFLRQLPQVEEIIEACDGAEAVSAIMNEKPDLVFLDIQMPAMNGFDVIEAVGTDRMPGVIFVTAYDQYAVDAFEVNAVDYLLKPYDEERFLRSFKKAEVLMEKKSAQSEVLAGVLKELRKEKKKLTRILVSHGTKYIFVDVAEIHYISADEKYLQIHASGGRYMVRETMNAMEEKLCGDEFARVHRSHIVNISQIKEIQPWSHGDYLIIMKNGEKLPLSRRYSRILRV